MGDRLDFLPIRLDSFVSGNKIWQRNGARIGGGLVAADGVTEWSADEQRIGGRLVADWWPIGGAPIRCSPFPTNPQSSKTSFSRNSDRIPPIQDRMGVNLDTVPLLCTGL